MNELCFNATKLYYHQLNNAILRYYQILAEFPNELDSAIRQVAP